MESISALVNMNSMATLSIIILNYNTPELTIRAVESCLDLTYKDIEICLVDNASSDDSLRQLKDKFGHHSNIKIIASDTNLGFAGGNNLALKNITTPYVLLLNSDAYFPAGSDIEKVLQYLQVNQDVGMLTPFVVLGNGSIDPACHRGIPTPWNAFCYFAKLEKVTATLPFLNRLFGGYHQTWKDISTIHPVQACTGAAMFVRLQAIEEVGLLDERFFMYGEDLDWCYRFSQLDWDIHFFPNLTVIHDKHSSGLKKTKKVAHHGVHSQTKSAFYDAMRLFYQKHAIGPVWLENAVLLGIHLLSKVK